ncbi:hypothetical protein FB451DRAFT_1230200 [Mycena latifolia]|nr:hypothetical protein FB451DRAFT_1230200 [Mycena latifolia]
MSMFNAQRITFNAPRSTAARFFSVLVLQRYVRDPSISTGRLLQSIMPYNRLDDEVTTLSDDEKASWAMDLRYVIHHLPFNVVLPNLSTIAPQMVDTVIESVNADLRAYLQWAIDDPDSPKLYLLREPEKDSAPIQKTLCFRHYLNMVNPKHRKALTRLLSSHCRALERLRWVELRRPRIDRNLRVCRFCKARIKSPERALLECTANAELVVLCNDFLTRRNNDIRGLPALNSMSAEEFFTLMISLITGTPSHLSRSTRMESLISSKPLRCIVQHYPYMDDTTAGY